METGYKSGFVAVIGRPNVGKSTLINSLIGQKVLIMSDKPQTTRNRILCVLSLDDAQILFLDTPGIHKPRHKLGEYMVNAAKNTLKEVDLILFVVDANEKMGAGEEYILEYLRETKTPVFLVVNKIDTLDKKALLPIIANYQKEYDFAATVPISALEHMNLTSLTDEIKNHLEEGPQYYPSDMVTDQPERQVCAEIIREKLLLCLDKEIPHGTAVELTKFSERIDSGIIDIDATIFCEKASHKGIIIGKNGSMLKKISSLARKDIEAFMGAKVYLETWVKVKENWRDNLNFIHDVGYRED